MASNSISMTSSCSRKRMIWPMDIWRRCLWKADMTWGSPTWKSNGCWFRKEDSMMAPSRFCILTTWYLDAVLHFDQVALLGEVGLVAPPLRAEHLSASRLINKYNTG